MGDCRPIFMKIGTQTKKNVLSEKITKAVVNINVQNGRRCRVGISSACYEIGNYRPILIKFGT
jgi:hypothetical protein